MTRAVIALPPNVPAAALSGAWSLPGVQPVALLEDAVAILEVPDALLATLGQLPGIALAAIDAVPNLNALDLAPTARPWVEAWNRLLDPQYLAAMATRLST
ncbi:hypothetical protein SAMN05660657_05714 [Geodermatophilus amargosae]|uniref:Uncharacterized protein n=1 Tax=Geodermatophilus amargosae TaxID=1296565 RepID=A0A1I7DF41_9ACTN|nr:hypothetical protein [Geodermatophilus amargosae]SFU10343.1 hypothetical protein SAMN05660657_05714 [Geodermatophilus amargosae]